ncbi:MAG: hypothetical protein FWE14_01155 [Lachnospiraceae bacterium]|nr:hypothetical protein [Lachnospiraceae bacterium]
MKKVLKKLAAFVCGLALLAPLVLVPSIDAQASGTKAFLQFASADWGVQTWDGEDGEGVTLTNDIVDGAGTYTVALTFDEPVNGIAFSSVEIEDGATLYPAGFMRIDSIKVNGEEIEYGETFTNPENGNIRTNLFNEWVDEIPDDAFKFSDEATATPMANDIEDISSIEVTFTLELAEMVAYLQFASSDWEVQAWGSDEGEGFTRTNEAVDGYGTYTVGLDFASPANGIAFFNAEVAFGEVLLPGAYMTIDSVKINGEEVSVGNTYTSSDDGVTTRTNLFNEWVDALPKDARTADGSDDATWVPVSNEFEEISSIEVTFTYGSGVWIFGDPRFAEEEEYVAPSSFNAFMMFQDAGGGEWSNFASGVGNDMEILGDGVWEVSITRDQAGGTGQAIPDESGLVFLVDIEELGRAMVHAGTLWEDIESGGMTGTDAEVSVEVYVDGELVSGIRNENIKYGDIEGNGRLRLELVNTWGTGTIENPVVMPSRLVPNDEIKVVFTLKGTGFNSDYDWGSAEEAPAPAEEAAPAATPAPAQTDDSGNNTTLIIIIVVVVVLVGGGGAYFFISKKKKD